VAKPMRTAADVAAAVALLPDDHPLRPVAESMLRYCEDIDAVFALKPPVEPYRVPPEVLARFTSEVAEVRADLSKVAPRILALAGHIAALRDTFNEMVPKSERRKSDEAWEVPWAESGMEALADRFRDLVERLVDTAGLEW